MLREKPPILTEVDFSKWCSGQECDLREGCPANLRDNLVYCDIEAQRDADAAYFRAEIEKLGVISDEEIDAAWPSQSGLEPPWETKDLEREIIRCCRAVAQSQLAKTKEDLIKTLEGK